MVRVLAIGMAVALRIRRLQVPEQVGGVTLTFYVLSSNRDIHCVSFSSARGPAFMHVPIIYHG